MSRTQPGRTLIGAVALSLAVASAWTLIVLLSSVVHASLFEVVPPDGVVSLEQRLGLDRAITSYLSDGNQHRLAALAEPEQAHLVEVRSLLPWLVGLLLCSAAVAWKLSMSVKIIKLCAGLTLIGSALTVVSFQAIFFTFHQAVFRDAPWVFAPSEYLLTQIYPYQFFLAACLLILVLSVTSLTVWAHALGQRERAKGHS